MIYNYREEMKKDIRNYIDENINYSDYESIKELRDDLEDTLFDEDSVTGNATGSYIFNTWLAKEYVIDNVGDLKGAIDEFGIDAETVTEKFINEDWEYFDVIIRCYLLNECIASVIDEIEAEFNAAHENE